MFPMELRQSTVQRVTRHLVGDHRVTTMHWTAPALINGGPRKGSGPCVLEVGTPRGSDAIGKRRRPPEIMVQAWASVAFRDRPTASYPAQSTFRYSIKPMISSTGRTGECPPATEKDPP